MKNCILTNARLPGERNSQQLWLNSQGIIEQIKPLQNTSQQDENRQVLDLGGDWLSLGGVDLQINGGLGLAFPDITEKDLLVLNKICDFLWEQGIDSFLPTIVTTSVEKIQRSLSVIAQFIEQQKIDQRTTATVLGVHLEGPFLNPKKRGAHPAEYLLTPTLETVKLVLGDYAKMIKIITLAPELDSAQEVIPYLRSWGIIVSLGHSQATDGEAQKAFDLGASMVTHAFNAMPPLHHRKPGLLGAAMINQKVYCGLIADGQHVCPTMMKIFVRSSEYEQGIFLVSDALAPLGLPDGIYPWDERQIEVRKGTASLADGTLAGTTLPLLVGVENLVKWEICKPETAIALATESPRKAIGLPGISVGQPAHFLRWHWQESTAKLTWQRLNSSKI